MCIVLNAPSVRKPRKTREPRPVLPTGLSRFMQNDGTFRCFCGKAFKNAPRFKLHGIRVHGFNPNCDQIPELERVVAVGPKGEGGCRFHSADDSRQTCPVCGWSIPNVMRNWGRFARHCREACGFEPVYADGIVDGNRF